MSEESKPLKIGIATHVFRDIDFSCYFNHMYCIAHWSRGYDLVLMGRRGLDAATARNQLVDKCIESGCTHVFFMDGDHIFPIETLDCLTQLSNEAMVSGLVCKRGEGYAQVAFQKKENRYMQVDLPLDGRQYEVAVCAFGCTLINLTEIQRLNKPYFRDECRQTANGDLYNFRSDINICELFAANGAKCWIDTRILVGHHGMDDIIYPQAASMKRDCDEMLRERLPLRQDQKGFHYAC